MSDDHVTIGYIKRAHGIRGGLLVVPLTDEPEQFKVGAVFGVSEGPEDISTLTVKSVAPHKEGVLLRTEESWDRNRAETLAKAQLTIPRSHRRSLESGEFWPEDLVGLLVVDPNGEQLGEVARVITGEAQDRLVVDTASGEVQVPFVAAIVGEPLDGRITIDAPEGLFPD